MIVLYLPAALLLLSTVFAVFSALGAPLWIGVLPLCVAAVASAMPVATPIIR